MLSGAVEHLDVAPQTTAAVTLGYKPEQVYALGGELLLTVRYLTPRTAGTARCTLRSARRRPADAARRRPRGTLRRDRSRRGTLPRGGQNRFGRRILGLVRSEERLHPFLPPAQRRAAGRGVPCGPTSTAQPRTTISACARPENTPTAGCGPRLNRSSTSFALTPGDSEVKAVADYAIPAVGARLRLTYTVAADGSVRISDGTHDRRPRAQGRRRPDALRHGLRNPGHVRRRGILRPRPDGELRRPLRRRLRGALRPACRRPVPSTKYVSPQESGMRAAGLRVVAADRRLGPGRGDLLRPPLLGIRPSRLPSRRARQRLARDTSLPGDLVPDGRTGTVNIESVQSGPGAASTAGTCSPRPEYLPPYGDYSVNFARCVPSPEDDSLDSTTNAKAANLKRLRLLRLHITNKSQSINSGTCQYTAVTSLHLFVLRYAS